jgi:RND family efflux transporter MFP subunit
MFRIANTDTLHVFVNVPQSYVTSVKTGQEAYLSVRNYPGKEFTGTIVRSTGALDPATRTLRYQIDFPNRDGVLYAGMYAEARLKVVEAQPPVVVPTSALVFDSTGTRVWAVEDGKVFPKVVSVGRDLGTEIEVTSGLIGNESVVTNPGERLASGVRVAIADTSPPSPSQAPAPSKPQTAAAR